MNSHVTNGPRIAHTIVTSLIAVREVEVTVQCAAVLPGLPLEACVRTKRMKNHLYRWSQVIEEEEEEFIGEQNTSPIRFSKMKKSYHILV